MQYNDFIAQNMPLEGEVSQLESIIPFYIIAFTVNAVIIVFVGNKTGLNPEENAVYSRLFLANAIAGAATTLHRCHRPYYALILKLAAFLRANEFILSRQVADIMASVRSSVKRNARCVVMLIVVCCRSSFTIPCRLRRSGGCSRTRCSCSRSRRCCKPNG